MRGPRPGFTLIELLVAIGILIVLSALTFSMVNVTMDADRIRSGSRDVQSYLEGARNQAIYAKEPRGVRFLLSPDDNTTVNSMLYIGPPTTFKSGSVFGRANSTLLNPPWEPNFTYVDDQIAVPTALNGFFYTASPGGLSGGSEPVWPTIPGNTVVDNGVTWKCVGAFVPPDWTSLVSRGLLTDGARIKLGNRWHTIANNAGVWELTTSYKGDVVQAPTYELELAPAVLPNQEPRLLPSRVVIDLDSSRLPTIWGTGPYSNQMDVLFTPRGNVQGTVGAAGRVHFVLSDTADTVLDCRLPSSIVQRADSTMYNPGDWVVSMATTEYQFRCVTGGTSGIGEPPLFTNPQVGATTNPGDDGTVTWLCHARRPSLVISLTTQTGNVASYPVHPTDPFLYAETGEVAQ